MIGPLARRLEPPSRDAWVPHPLKHELRKATNCGLSEERRTPMARTCLQDCILAWHCDTDERQGAIAPIPPVPTLCTNSRTQFLTLHSLFHILRFSILMNMVGALSTFPPLSLLSLLPPQKKNSLSLSQSLFPRRLLFSDRPLRKWKRTRTFSGPSLNNEQCHTPRKQNARTRRCTTQRNTQIYSCKFRSKKKCRQPNSTKLNPQLKSFKTSQTTSSQL